MFENQSGTVTLVPFSGAQCSVNGVLVSEPSQLNQGEELLSAAASAPRTRPESGSAAPRRRHSAGPDQHVSLQPSQGGGPAAGEAEGEAALLPPDWAEGLTGCVSSRGVCPPQSGLLSTFSLSMTDLSQSCENLSTVMLYNPG